MDRGDLFKPCLVDAAKLGLGELQTIEKDELRLSFKGCWRSRVLEMSGAFPLPLWSICRNESNTLSCNSAG